MALLAACDFDNYMLISIRTETAQMSPAGCSVKNSLCPNNLFHRVQTASSFFSPKLLKYKLFPSGSLFTDTWFLQLQTCVKEPSVGRESTLTHVCTDDVHQHNKVNLMSSNNNKNNVF